jgi:hypothetical protein
MLPAIDPYQLLHGPYTPQPLRRGDKATCLFRDCDVVITGWSDGHIPWPPIVEDPDVRYWAREFLEPGHQPG